MIVPALAALGVVGGATVYSLLVEFDVAYLSCLMVALAPPYFFYMAGLETLLAWRARSFFSPGQKLRSAWGWLVLAGLLRLVGFLIAAVHGYEKWGQVFSGLFSAVAACLGMCHVRSALREVSWLKPLRGSDQLILGVLWIYLAHHLWLIWNEVGRQGFGHVTRTLLWFVVPVLLCQAWQALVIRRAMLALGSGMLSRCWSAIAASVLLIVVGNLWLLEQGRLAFSAGPWLLADSIWILPYALAALAPALQIEASALALDSAALRALDQKHSEEDNRHGG